MLLPSFLVALPLSSPALKTELSNDIIRKKLHDALRADLLDLSRDAEKLFEKNPAREVSIDCSRR